MPLPRSVARLNRSVTNRILGPLAPYLPAFGVVIHRGRTSGRLYRTPVNVFRRPDGFVIALTYGATSDWVRNVLAHGGCLLETRGRIYELTSPRLIHDPTWHYVPGMLRLVGRLGHVTDFLELTLAAIPARPASPGHPFTTAAGTASGPTSAIVSSKPLVRSTWRMVVSTA